jgi:hypothetical protein
MGLNELKGFFKQSSLKHSELIIIQQFLEMSFQYSRYNSMSNAVTYSASEIVGLLNEPFDLRRSFSTPLQPRDCHIYTYRLCSFYGILIKLVRQVLWFPRATYALASISLPFLRYSFDSKSTQDGNTSIIVESQKLVKSWSIFHQCHFIAIEKLDAAFGVPTPKLSSKTVYIRRSKADFLIDVPLSDIFSHGLSTALLKSATNHITIDRNATMLSRALHLPRRSFFCFSRYVMSSIFRKYRVFFLDNSQGCMASSPACLSLIDSVACKVFNIQHGSGFYEFDRPDYVLGEMSPAYARPLVGFLQGGCIRPDYPLNGRTFSLGGSRESKRCLILESAHPLERKVSSRIDNNHIIHNSEYVSLLLQRLADLDFTPFLRSHPRSSSNFEAISPEFKLEYHYGAPLKYIPNANDFELVILLGLGHSLIYHLLRETVHFFVLAEPSDYRLSMYGSKLASFLIQNKMLYTPEVIYDPSSFNRCIELPPTPRSLDYTIFGENENLYSSLLV